MAVIWEPWESDDDTWRGDRWLLDWPEEAYLTEGEYALFQRDLKAGTWITTRSAATSTTQPLERSKKT